MNETKILTLDTILGHALPLYTVLIKINDAEIVGEKEQTLLNNTMA